VRKQVSNLIPPMTTFANSPFHNRVVNQFRIGQSAFKKQRLLGLAVSMAFLFSLFLFNSGSAHAAARSTSACSFHVVQSVIVSNANTGVSMGALDLLSNRCGSVEIHARTSQSLNIAIALSDGGYYQLYSSTCYLSYGCWSSSLTYGHISVFASTTFSFQGVEYAYTETGYHTGYE
jgi:hypothetical protein